MVESGMRVDHQCNDKVVSSWEVRATVGWIRRPNPFRPLVSHFIHKPCTSSKPLRVTVFLSNKEIATVAAAKATTAC